MGRRDLLSLKRVLDALGVSRATLWRASRSGIEGFPAPTVIRRRVYWATAQLPALERALDAYEGRCVFEDRRARQRRRTQNRHKDLVEVRRAVGARNRRRRAGVAPPGQTDLFGQ